MPRMVPFEMPVYKSDLGISYDNVRFKIRDPLAGLLQSCAGYKSPKTSVNCGFTRLLKPRALIATFDDGARVRYPIPEISILSKCAKDLLNGGKVVCLDLDGEEWYTVPPQTGDYTPKFQNFNLAAGKAKKITGIMEYKSDVLGGVNLRWQMEEDPTKITKIAQDCVNDKGFNACAVRIPIRARHVIFKSTGRKLQSQSNPDFVHLQKIVRKYPVDGIGGVCECIKKLGNESECVGYKGESIKNLHLLLDDKKKCGSSGSSGGGSGGGSGQPALPGGQ